jgi:3-keto-5-aminohexanoate cleavage enzyme
MDMSVRPFTISLACTGVVPTRALSPHVPITHDEIIDDIACCLELGVQMFHLHARDEDGNQSADPERYGRLIEAIRKLPGGRNAVLCVTTSGRNDSRYESRSQVLELTGDMKPDMASLTPSSLNFATGASVNEPGVIEALAGRMLENDIKPEIEIFDLGMANYLKVLIRKQLVRAPYCINVLLGNVAGAQVNPIELGALVAALPEDRHLALAGIGRSQLSSNVAALLFADGVRTGLEDNLWMDHGRQVPAKNIDFVKRALHIAEILERPMLDRSALREKLGLSKPAFV